VCSQLSPAREALPAHLAPPRPFVADELALLGVRSGDRVCWLESRGSRLSIFATCNPGGRWGPAPGANLVQLDAHHRRGAAAIVSAGGAPHAT